MKLTKKYGFWWAANTLLVGTNIFDAEKYEIPKERALC